MTWEWLLQTAFAALIALVLASAYNVMASALKKRQAMAMRGSFSFVLVGIAAFLGVSSLSMLEKMRQPHVTPENVEQKIRGWLDTFELSTKRLSKAEVSGSLFALEVTSDSGIPIAVCRQEQLPRYLLMQVTIKLSPEHQILLSRLTAEEVNQVIQDVQVEMSRCKTPSKVFPSLEQVAIQTRLPITDDLSEDAFMHGLDELDFSYNVARYVIVQDLERFSGEKLGSAK